MAPPHVTPIACLRDNYAYVVRPDPQSRDAIVIDASEADPVWRTCEKHGWRVHAIVSTHHHPDHTGGNIPLASLCAAHYAPPAIVGGHLDVACGRIPGATEAMQDQQRRRWGGVELTAWETPGHTRGALCYVFEAGQAVFTGDTLFLSGCGRLFEGTAAQMWAAMQRLRALPPQTAVFCGHEYTQKNRRFAATVLPLADEASADDACGDGVSVPGRIAVERRLNPFFLADDVGLQKRYKAGSAVELFALWRQARDTF